MKVPSMVKSVAVKATGYAARIAEHDARFFSEITQFGSGQAGRITGSLGQKRAEAKGGKRLALGMAKNFSLLAEVSSGLVSKVLGKASDAAGKVRKATGVKKLLTPQEAFAEHIANIVVQSAGTAIKSSLPHIGWKRVAEDVTKKVT